jgi:opacity protein-like surface antigen
MKKIVAIAAFFTLLYSTASAQDTDLRLGFQISPAFSSMGTDDNKINPNGTNLGLKMGARGEVYFRENYAFLVGLGFAFNTGGTLLHEQNFEPIWPNNPDLPPNANWGGNVNLKYGIQYVEIPFGLKFRTNEMGYFRYFAEVPVITLGFKSQARGAFKNSGINEEKIDIKKDVNGLALSWGLTGGVEYSISGSTSLVGGVGFQRVFTDVTKDHGSGVNSKAHITNIIIHLGVMF